MGENTNLLFVGAAVVLLALLLRSAFVYGHRTKDMPDGESIVLRKLLDRTAEYHQGRPLCHSSEMSTRFQVLIRIFSKPSVSPLMLI